MKCTTIVAKNKKGEFVTLHAGSDVSEAKNIWRKLKTEKNDYLGLWLFYMAQGRVISKQGYIAESEAKEKALVTRSKEKKIKESLKKVEDADKKAEAAAKKADEARIEAEQKAGGRGKLDAQLAEEAKKAKEKEAKKEEK
jgi:hypothetical protein